MARTLTTPQLFKDLLRRIPPGPESEEWAKSVNHNELVSTSAIHDFVARGALIST